MLRNLLTLGILLGSPAAVIAMFAVLFRPGALTAGGDTAGAVMEAYWLAFAGFFFGLTYGLLQVVTEVPILRREHQSGVSDVAYLGSKIALLAPLLMIVNAAIIIVLRVLDRLPRRSPGTSGSTCSSGQRRRTPTSATRCLLYTSPSPRDS